MPKRIVRLTEGGRRLDAVLASLLQGEMSRSRIQEMMRAGRITLEGLAARPSSEARPGQEVVLDLPEAGPGGIVPLDAALTILYEDEACLAIDKPSGLVTHPAKGHWNDTLVNILASTGRTFSSGSAPDRPGILHRLDKETSGILLVAKTDSAHAALAAQFQARSISKTYLALVWGTLEKEVMAVDAPIGRHSSQRKKMAVREDGRAAQTHFRLLERLPHIGFVEASPMTGRTHQIRVHLAHLRHPVLGDGLYGGHPENGLPLHALRDAVHEAGRFFLHAHKLTFESPARGEVTVISPLPQSFADMMELFKTHG